MGESEEMYINKKLISFDAEISFLKLHRFLEMLVNFKKYKTIADL